MIKKVKIQNFRSIKNLEIELNKINAFIGANNVGKSNIMKALDLIVGGLNRKLCNGKILKNEKGESIWQQKAEMG